MNQLKVMGRMFLRSELANIERLLSPILFAATVLLLFYFAFGEVGSEVQAQLFIAQTFLTAFFALQIALSRAFEPEQEDQAFTLMRTYDLSAEGWFLSKFMVVLGFSALVFVPTVGLASFFNQQMEVSIWRGGVLLTVFLAMIGLAALGVLVSAMMLRAEAKQFLYPLIYFPLTTPVLLAAVQVTQAIVVDGKAVAGLFESWLGLLVIFDVIYLTLSVLLYGELVKSD